MPLLPLLPELPELPVPPALSEFAGNWSKRKCQKLKMQKIEAMPVYRYLYIYLHEKWKKALPTVATHPAASSSPAAAPSLS